MSYMRSPLYIYPNWRGNVYCSPNIGLKSLHDNTMQIHDGEGNMDKAVYKHMAEHYRDMMGHPDPEKEILADRILDCAVDIYLSRLPFFGCFYRWLIIRFRDKFGFWEAEAE